MTRFGRTLLTLLVVAFCATPLLAQQGFHCAHTGFNSNVGATGKSFRCAPVRTLAGVGTLTFNATTTVTGTAGAFQDVSSVFDAVPGADATFFRTSGLWAQIGSELQFLRITAKASDTSITALLGAGATSLSGTATKWGVWNTTCYRTAAAFGDNQTDAATNTDARLWASSTAIANQWSIQGSGQQSAVTWIGYSHTAGGTVGAAAIVIRPPGLATAGLLSPGGYVTNSFNIAPVAAARNASIGGQSAAVQLDGRQFQVALSTSTVDTYFTVCAYSSR